MFPEVIKKKPDLSMLSYTDNHSMNIDVSSTVQSQRYEILNDYRRNGQFCDMSINVEGGKIRAHKVILASCIPYFKTMLTLDMKESRMDEVDIPGIEYATMVQLIEYAYTGKMEITTDNVQSIITSAHYLQLTDLVDYCSWFLTRQIDQNNCFDIWRLFKQLGLSCDTFQIAADYIRSSFLSISKQDGFIELDIDELVELLSCDQLYTDNEYDVLDRSMLWLRAKQGRQQYVERISQCIRIPPSKQLILSLLSDSDRLEEAVTHTSKPTTDCIIKPRSCQKWILTIFAEIVGGSFGQGYIFDPIMRTKTKVDGMKLYNTHVICDISVYKRRVIVAFGKLVMDEVSDEEDMYDDNLVGFETFHKEVVSVEMFDFDTGEWTTLPKIERQLEEVTSTVVGNKLYLISEHDQRTVLDIYDFETKKWTTGKNTNGTVRKPKIAVIGKYFYVLGQWWHSSSNVRRYDTEEDTWEFVANRSTERYNFLTTVYKGKLYVAGGDNGDFFFQRKLTTMEVYDPVTNTWSCSDSSNPPKSISSLVATQDGIYASGSRLLHHYNLETNEWSTVADLPKGYGIWAVPVSPYGL